MSNLSPSDAVDAPPVGTEEHNLLASVEAISVSDNHWEMGLKFFPEGDVHPVLAEILDVGAAKSTPSSGSGESSYIPFLIELAVKRPLGWTEAEVEAIALRALEQTQSSLIEDLLAAGSVSGSQYLADANLTLIGSDAAVPEVALARLETAIAAQGGHATIYMSPGVATILGSAYLYEVGDKLYTLRGDLVVVGNLGNQGPGATTATTDQSYIYAHIGEPVLRLGSVQVYSAIDHTINERVVRVERTVSVVFVPNQWITLAKYI